MKKVLSSILSLFVLGLLFVSNPIMTHASVNFNDINTKQVFFNEVNYIANRGIITGYKEGNKNLFKPSNSVTRYQAMSMILKAKGETTVKAPSHTFNDVKKIKVNEETQRIMEIAYSKGYILKNQAGNIRPNAPISRYEMAYALSQAFNLKQPVTSSHPSPFSDVTSQNANAPFVNGLYYGGVTDGSVATFKGANSLTRGQFAMFVARALSNDFKLPVQPSKMPGAQKAPFTNGEVNLTSDTLNVRHLPSMQGGTIGKLAPKAKVTVTHSVNGWYFIEHNNLKGYVASNYIKETQATEVSPPAQKPSPEPEKPATTNTVARVLVNGLNIRSNASANSARVDVVNKGAILSVHSVKGDWAHVTLPNGKKGYAHKLYVKLINKTGNPLKDRIIVLDAGHGGHDPGAISPGREVNEKSITLDVTKRVEQKLRNAGANVKLTRSNDTYVDLAGRTKFASSVNAEAFVSIHVNSAGNLSATGTETYFNSTTNLNAPESRLLASSVQKQIVQQAKMRDRGVKDGPFYVIRNNNMPAILIELGFIGNKADRDKMMNDRYLDIFAQAIYDGIYNYYKE